MDELDRLRESPALRALLTHYTGASDRETWLDRLMELEGVAPADLVGLHGELIAYDWVQQNTGVVVGVRPGTVPGCYRCTAAGLRALRRADADDEDEDRRRTAA